MKLENIQVGDSLLWRHRYANELVNDAKRPEQLQRQVKVIAVLVDSVKTNFGEYWLANGCSVHIACGCNRFCDCWGEVELIERSK